MRRNAYRKVTDCQKFAQVFLCSYVQYALSAHMCKFAYVRFLFFAAFFLLFSRQNGNVFERNFAKISHIVDNSLRR